MSVISGGAIIGDQPTQLHVQLALAAGTDTAGGVLAWQNPHDQAIIVTRLVLDITTEATGACTLDAGSAANGTTSSDNLIDGLDVHSATGTFDNIEDQGTSGTSRQKLAANGGATDYLTVSTATGASAGLVGYAYVWYVLVGAL